MAVEYLVGAHLSVLELSRPQVLADLGRLLRRWHDSDVALPEASLMAARASYLAAVPDGRLPAGLVSAAADADAVEAELTRGSLRHGPAHLDVVANLVVTDSGLRLIDFEYAASADPARELGQVVWEAELDRTAARRLVQAYAPGGGVADTATDSWAWVTGVTWTIWAFADAGGLQRYALRSWERLQSHWSSPGA
jgi:aminoglycoside phosphotransferase (APT) family kinase protein